MSDKLQGKMAIVTGAARGIGAAIALELARNGADIMLCDILPYEQAESLLEEIKHLGRRAEFFRADVGNREQVEQLIEQTVRSFGRVDILVNNAARSIRKPFLELEVSDVEETWSACMWSVFHCSQLAARQMVKQGEGGAMVMISSVLSSRPLSNSTAYNSAKAAINQMARTCALELAQHRIRVNIVEPGWTDTPGERDHYSEEQIQEQGRKLLMGRLARPGEVAKAVLFLVSDDASYVTGSVLRADGGYALNH